MDPGLQALTKLFVEFLLVIVILSNFSKLCQALLLKVLLSHKEYLVLCKQFPERCSAGMSSSQSKMVKKNATDIQLDVVALLLGLKQVEGRTTFLFLLVFLGISDLLLL